MFAKSIFVLCFGLGAFSAPAVAQSFDEAPAGSKLIKSVDVATLEEIITAAGGADIDARLSNGQPIATYSQDGTNYAVFGAACGGADSDKCVGVNMYCSFTLDRALTADELNGFNNKWAVLSVEQTEDGSVQATRYLILDHGQAFDNLVLNMKVFNGAAKQLGELLYQ